VALVLVLVLVTRTLLIEAQIDGIRTVVRPTNTVINVGRRAAQEMVEREGRVSVVVRDV
jgi:hypothetical protein